MNVHSSGFGLAGPLALIITEVTALVDYEVRTASVFAAAALFVAQWAGPHQLQNGLFVNNVLWSCFLSGRGALLWQIYLKAYASELTGRLVHYCHLLATVPVRASGRASDRCCESGHRVKNGRCRPK